ncbi:MAG: hypothetical protein HY298_22895 [Verrucomicrobia bacterium]|nr:hypothetical protein [Verrucomicrobiota bacterium]
MPARLFDSTIVHTPQQALDFIGNILESSTGYSIIGKDLDGKILLRNEGAHRRGQLLHLGLVSRRSRHDRLGRSNHPAALRRLSLIVSCAGLIH